MAAGMAVMVALLAVLGLTESHAIIGRRHNQTIWAWTKAGLQRDMLRTGKRASGRLLGSTDVTSGAPLDVAMFGAEVVIGQQKSLVKIDTVTSWTYMKCNAATIKAAKPVGCCDPACPKTATSRCDASMKPCPCTNEVMYMEGALASLSLFKVPSLSLGRDTNIANAFVGCADTDEERGYTGSLGLGRGAVNMALKMGGKFSYRFPDYLTDGKGSLCIGPTCTAGKTAVVTEILPSPAPVPPSVYVVGLSGVSVGEGQPMIAAGVTTTAVDTTAFISRIQKPAYEALKAQFLQKVSPSVKKAPGDQYFDTCFAIEIEEVLKDKSLFPTVSLHLAGAQSKLILPPVATIAAIGEPGHCCLAFAPSDDPKLNILGSFTQQTLTLAFDLPANTLSVSAST